MKKSRIEFERDALRRMIFMYCKGHSHEGAPCGECRALLEYASRRLDACRFGNEKRFCSACPVHCYRSDMRQAIRRVMRYSGPRMLYKAPLMALKHLLKK